MPYALYDMPLLIHATAWWLAGLLADAWWDSSPPLPVPLPVLLLIGALVVMLRSRRIEPLLLPVALVAAWSSRTERDRCLALAQREVQQGHIVWLRISTVEPPRGRRPRTATGTVSERASRARCGVRALVQFAAVNAGTPTVAPGALLPLRATSLRTGQTLRLTNAEVEGAAAGQSPLIAWRARLGRTIDQQFRSRAPLVRALLIADQQGIAPEIRDMYADAGLVHMLSVSGMHVAIIAGALLTIGGAARIPRPLLDPLAIALVTWYIALLGFPAPAVRSGVMLAVMSLSKLWQRPLHEWTALALGAALPTWDPLVVQDLGYQLSVGGMAALVAARAFRRRWQRNARTSRMPDSPLPRAWHWLFTREGVAGWLVTEIVTGLIATAVTLPIIAWTFGRVSLVAPMSNVLAGPVVSALQPALFLALLWALLVPGSAAMWLPDATQPLMALLDGIARVCAATPGAVLPTAPTLTTVVGMGVVAGLLVRASAAQRRAPWCLAAAVVATATLWVPIVFPHHGELELHILDVGQGDALALRTPRGRWILVDAGRRWQGGDTGRRTVIPYVRRHGGEVALFVLSHPHDDHAGGAAAVVRALHPRQWWEPAFVSASPGYREALDAVQEGGVRWERVRPGRRLVLDDVTLTVLAPDSAWTVAQRDANETSVVVRVDFGHTRFLLTGDAERDEEAWLLRHYPPEALVADVLKLGHHGSRTSSSPALLDAVAPRLAIASVGAGNRYGHPAPETLRELLVRDIPALRTDLEGTIVVRSNGRRVAVRSGADDWIIPPRTDVR